MIKAVLLDFDGTLVDTDMLSLVCGIVRKQEESEQLDADFQSGKMPGRTSLIQRINYLKGVTQIQIDKEIKGNLHLMPGAEELMKYFRDNKIVTILSSGNIMPILRVYQKILKIDYVIGSQPNMDGEIIQGIEEVNFSSGDFKLDESKKILAKLGIKASETMTIGDSRADISKFKFATLTIAINPNDEIKQYADHIVNDLFQALKLVKKIKDLP